LNWIFELLGFAGVGISCFAYVPQIVHLLIEHCSAGVSVKAWLLWLVASFLIFVHALRVLDVVFMALQIANIFAITMIIVLSKRYRNMFCETHRPAAMRKRSAMIA